MLGECTYRNDAHPFQKIHHKRQLKSHAETNGQEQHESHPFADSRIRIDSQPFIETKKKSQHRLEYEEEKQHGAEKEQAQTYGQIDVDVSFFVRVKSGSHENPDLIKNPGAGDQQAY